MSPRNKLKSALKRAPELRRSYGIMVVPAFELQTGFRGNLHRHCFIDLGQLAKPYFFEVNGRTFGLEAKKPGVRLALLAAGNFFTVDPKSNFTVDRAYVVVIPLAEAAGTLLAWEAAQPVGR